jgi:2-aminoethylphosphonate dioxygenase
MAYAITPSQHAFFAKNGYLILRDVLSPIETIALQQWAQEVHDLPRTPETPWMPYEEVNAVGDRVLCRTENYANYHAKFNGLLRGDKLLGILGQLSGEEMLLFKEKSECGLSVPPPM